MKGDTTQTVSSRLSVTEEQRVPALTILWHSSLGRVGERVLLADVAFGGSAEIARNGPDFGPARAAPSQPLVDSSVSRSPLRITGREGGVTLACDKPGKVRVDGSPLRQPVFLSVDALDAGAIIELSPQVSVVLHRHVPGSPTATDLGLVGQSEAMGKVRREICKVAPYPVTVLLCGESGTGKELAARAIHAESTCRDGPFVSVNMAAIPPGTAAATLFGHRKGSFTGATAAATGVFDQARGGTLFLDEIGATPVELQAALLRALDTGEVQPVGGAASSRVNVRVVAATDTRLREAVDAGQFLQPLLYRLQSYELVLPALRQRREDIGQLLLHLLRQEFGGRQLPTGSPASRSATWLQSSLVAELARQEFPGNVRELRNVARRLVIDWGSEPEVGVASLVPSARQTRARDRESTASASGPRRASGNAPPPTEQEVLTALEKARWRPSRAAQALQISRTTLYALMNRSSLLTTARELTPEAIRHQLLQSNGDLECTAEALRVSSRGLRLRLSELKDDTLHQLIRPGGAERST